MPTSLITPTTIVGGLTLLGGVVMVLKKMGLVTFGKNSKPKDNPGKVECPDRDCQTRQAVMSKEVEILGANQEKMWEKFEVVAEDINYVKGRIDEAIKAARE